MPKIFVCDDDVEILEMMSLLLGVMGYEVVTESNSLEAYARIKELQPDLTIVDLWMPVLAGTDLIKIVKDDATLRRSPVLAFSASKDGENLALGAGADDFLAKPFSLDLLKTKVSNLLIR